MAVAVQHLHDMLSHSQLGSLMTDVCQAEWWAHCRWEPGNAAMPVSVQKVACCNHSKIPGHCDSSLHLTLCPGHYQQAQGWHWFAGSQMPPTSSILTWTRLSCARADSTTS